jgi:hypothetical protein
MSDSITLIIAGSEKIKVSSNIARLSELIKTIVDESPSDEIPLEQLTKIYYCEKCNYSSISQNGLIGNRDAQNFENWHREFIQQLMEKDKFFSLVFAAEHLQIKPLLELLLAYLAKDLSPLSVEELCLKNGIDEPLTEDVEEELLKEYPWVYNINYRD